MHSTEASGGTTFHHNGDYSGDVQISVTAEITEVDLLGNGYVEVPFADLHELVLGYLAHKLGTSLKQFTPAELEEFIIGRLHGE